MLIIIAIVLIICGALLFWKALKMPAGKIVLPPQ